MRKLPFIAAIVLLGSAILWILLHPQDRDVIVGKRSTNDEPASRHQDRSIALPKRSHTPRGDPVAPIGTFQPSEGHSLIESPLDERVAYLANLRAESADLVLDAWVNEGRERVDRFKFEVLGQVLAAKLRQDDGDEATGQILERIRKVIDGPDAEQFLEWSAINLLGQAASPGALKTLLDLLGEQTVGSERESHILGQIASMGDVRPDGRFREALASVLISAWNSEQIEGRLDALAIALAKVGCSSTVELLMQEIAKGATSVPEFEAKATAKSWAAIESIGMIRNAQCIGVLAMYLQGDLSSEVNIIAAGEALSQIGQPEATMAIINWAKRSEVDNSHYITFWLKRMRDEGSMALAAGADIGVDYRLDENRSAVLNAWKYLQPLPSGR